MGAKFASGSHSTLQRPQSLIRVKLRLFWLKNSTEVLLFPSPPDESGDLHGHYPWTVTHAQLLTISTACSGTLQFPSEPLTLPFTALPGLQSTVQSEDWENSFNTCLSVPVTHVQAAGLTRLLMIKSFKELQRPFIAHLIKSKVN